MPCISRSFVRPWILVALAVAAVAGSARAQDDPWVRLVLEADSIGPETPRFAPSRWTPCAAVPAADSVRVGGPTGRPLTFVLERDHRYFYLVFSLRPASSYAALTLFTVSPGSCFRWAEEHGRFSPVACPGVGGRKC
jgi:hypothetical protein